MTSTANNAEILVKAITNINQASNVTVTTSAGAVKYWADADNNSTGYVQLKSGSSITTSGGAITIGGGLDPATGFAYGTTSETCSEDANLYISGVHIQAAVQLNSGGGHISLRGQSASNATSNMAFGVSIRGNYPSGTTASSIISGAGKIAINGVASGSGTVNGQGASTWGAITMRSANPTADAISVIGDASALNLGANGASLGINFTGLFEATEIGGGITINGKAGTANTVAGVNISGSVLAKSGPINFIGESTNNVQPIFFGADLWVGKKVGSNVESSSSNVVITANDIVIGSAVHLIDCSGSFTLQSLGTSFPSAFSWPLANLTLASSVSGLTIGKTTNTADVTIASATSVAGPITIYGGTIALNAILATTNSSSGNISLNGTTLSGNANISLAMSRMLTTNFSSAASYSGIISGNSSNFMQAGTGVFTLTGANTYTGTTTVAAGGLTLNRTGGGTLASATNLTVSGGALEVNSDQVFQIVSLSSGSLTNNAGVNLTIEANYIGGGTLTNNGTLILVGPQSVTQMSPPPTNFPGTFTTVSAMNNLTIDDLLGVSLDKDLSVTGTLNLTAGTLYLNTNTLTINGSLTRTNGVIYAIAGTLAFGNSSDLNLPTSIISGNVKNLQKMNGAGTVTINDNMVVSNNMSTSASIGALIIAANKQLTVQGTLTNNGTFTLKDGATFVPGIAANSIQGMGTFNVEKQLTGNSSTWNTANNEGRFWYMGVPMVSVARSSFGTPGSNSNRIWSYSENTKLYTEITNGAAMLSAGTGYVHRRNDNNLITYTASGPNGLYGDNFSLNGLTRTAGTFAGYHLISNPYMAYLDWEAVTSSNIESTYYIRSASPTNISALISCNKDNDEYVSTAAATIDEYTDVRYIAPLQSIWVRVGTTPSTGSISATRSMLSHQSSNPGLKSTTVYPVLARVNLVNDTRYDQLLVFMNEYQSNATNNFDSEKMFVSGEASIYTMASGKKLVMNGLKNNKKKISVPLYLELPTSKVYQLQLSQYIMEDGLILLEDKQEGTIQDFTINDTYAFYANSGVLSNRFVLHFYMPDAGVSAQGPSNSWVEEESPINEGGSILVSSNGRGKVTITQDIDASSTEKGSVIVRDASGREIFNGQLTGSATNLELDTPSGIYFVSVELNGQVEVKKIFVQQ
jgi:autotransporter-associated beta strand protein